MNLKNTSLTLTELLIATIILGIVMLGIAAVDFSFRQSQKGTSQNALVAMRTSAIMLHITKNAELATGNRSTPGATSGINIPSADTLWIRLENPAQTPGNYLDDVWVRYSYNTTNYNLYFCSGNPDGVMVCPDFSETLGTLAGFSASTGIDDSLGVQTFYVEITLTNRINPALGPNIFDNPEYILKARVNPASSSY